jgi:hypothetical protein
MTVFNDCVVPDFYLLNRVDRLQLILSLACFIILFLSQKIKLMDFLNHIQNFNPFSKHSPVCLAVQRLFTRGTVPL